MSRPVDYAFVCMIVGLAGVGLSFHAAESNPQTAHVVDILLKALVVTVPCWPLIRSALKRQWSVAILALLAETLAVSQVMAPPQSPVGRNQWAFVLPLLMFERASFKRQMLAVVLGSIQVIGAVVVNAGLLGFGTSARSVAWIGFAIFISLINVRFAGRLSKSSNGPAQGTPNSHSGKQCRGSIRRLRLHG